MKAKFYVLTSAFVLLLNGRLFAQEAEAPVLPDDSLWQTLIMIGIAFMFFYVILWRPEQKRRKALEDQRSSLQRGDRVSALGIIGTVVKIGDQTVILKMYDGSKLEFYKAAISDVIPETDESGKKVEILSDDE
jgi:preprotein translocase subunit YajC